MIENLRQTRKFYAMMIALLAVPLLFVIHMGYITSIPYVPTMLIFRFPALCVLTVIYIQFVMTVLALRLRLRLRRAASVKQQKQKHRD